MHKMRKTERECTGRVALPRTCSDAHSRGIAQHTALVGVIFLYLSRCMPVLFFSFGFAVWRE